MKTIREIATFICLLAIAFVFSAAFSSDCQAGNPGKNNNYVWTGTWSTAPQLVEPNNMPPAPGLTNNTLRQIVCVSIGGDSIRVRFSNDFSKSAVTMKAVYLSVATEGSSIDLNTIKELKFRGQPSVTMAPGSSLISDPLSFHLEPRMKVAITINFGETSATVTGHPGSRTTSYLLEGTQSPASDFSKAVPTDHWYVINGIDVKTPKNSGAIAIIGNSITDGRGSGTNKQNRWPDILAARLLKNKSTANIGVLNLGIGGNCVVQGGLGPTALSRFDRDILAQSNVKWLIILEGVNDIGGTRNAEAAEKTAAALIKAYEEMIDKAHSKGIKVYGATILPFAKSFYDTDFRIKAHQTVNNWIRNSGRFDKVIDFEKIMSNPDDPTQILPDMHSGDLLHPNEAGYERMGNAIDLKLFK
jgi:lysophospholipase L1-like esterase